MVIKASSDKSAFLFLDDIDEEQMDVVQYEHYVKEKCYLLKKIQDKKEESDFWYELANHNKYIWDDVKLYFKGLHAKILSYIDSKDDKNKEAKGYFLYGALKIYSYVKPIIGPLVKDAKNANKGRFESKNEIIKIFDEISSFEEKITLLEKEIAISVKKDYASINRIKYISYKSNKDSLYATIDVFLRKQSKAIFDKEYKKYKEEIIKNIQEIELQVSLDNEQKKLFDSLVDKDNLDDVSLSKNNRIVLLCLYVDRIKSSAGDFDKLSEYIQKFSKFIYENRDVFYNLDPETAKNFLESWKICMVKSVYCAESAKSIAYGKCLNSLYVIYDYIKGKPLPKKIVNVIYNIDVSKSKLNEIVNNIQNELNNTKAAKYIKDKIENSLNKLYIKQNNTFLKDINKVSVDILKGFAIVGTVVNPVLKIALPNVGAAIGWISSGFAMTLLKMVIPGGQVLAIADTPVVYAGYYLGEFIGKLGYRLFDSVDASIQNTKENKDMYNDVSSRINNWYKKSFPKKYISMDGELDIYDYVRGFKRNNYALAKVIHEEILSPLKEIDPNNEKLLEVDNNLKYIIKKINKDDGVDLNNMVDKLQVSIESINDYLDSRLSGISNSEKINKLEKLSTDIKDVGHNTEEIRFKLLIAVGEFTDNNKNFTDRMKKIESDDKLLKDINSLYKSKSGIFSVELEHKLRKIERDLLYLVCTVNYILVPVVRFSLPIACGFSGYLIGSAIGASGDAATAGASLGIISLTTGAVSYVLGGLIGNALAGGYGLLDKKFRERLSLLNKELAIIAVIPEPKTPTDTHTKKFTNSHTKPV